MCTFTPHSAIPHFTYSQLIHQCVTLAHLSSIGQEGQAAAEVISTKKCSTSADVVFTDWSTDDAGLNMTCQLPGNYLMELVQSCTCWRLPSHSGFYRKIHQASSTVTCYCYLLNWSFAFQLINRNFPVSRDSDGVSHGTEVVILYSDIICSKNTTSGDTQTYDWQTWVLYLQ